VVSVILPFETAMLVFYSLSIVTIRPQFAIECLKSTLRSTGRAWVTLEQKMGRKGLTDVR